MNVYEAITFRTHLNPLLLGGDPNDADLSCYIL